MAWAVFVGEKKCDLVLLEGRKTAEKYINTLLDYLLPFINEGMPEVWVFMQDEASTHKADRTLEFLEEVHWLEWPAESLNPIENIWAILAREVDADCRQFNDLDFLKNAVVETWENIAASMLKI